MTTAKIDWMFVLDAIEAETNVRPTIQTASRLIRQGDLEARKVLGRWMTTTRELVQAYVSRQTELAMSGRLQRQVSHKTRSESRRQKAMETANRELDLAGITLEKTA